MHAVLSRMRRDLSLGLWIIVAAVLLGMAVNALRRDPLPLMRLSPEEELIEGLDASHGTATSPFRVELEEAIQAYEKKSAVFVDARESAFFERGSIPGAINLSREAFAEKFPAFAQGRDQAQRIIVYCSEENCSDSTIVARALLKMGFGNVAVFEGGWDEWTAAGMPQSNEASD